MSYIKHDWKSGDVVSSTKLNEIEDGIFNSQEKITESAKLSADLLSEGTANKLVSADEKASWNSKTSVSIPTESESTNEAKFITVDGTDYKLASGEGKNWTTIELSLLDLRKMAQGEEIVRPLSPLYDDANFKNDYFITKVEQTRYSEATAAWVGADMKKVYINVDGFINIAPYFSNTISNYIKEIGFDHNYYKTIALFGACPRNQGKTLSGEGTLDGPNVIYLQDVSQQKWEYNYDAAEEKEMGKVKREDLDNDIIGSAFVISVKGKGDAENPDCGFLLCISDSQAAYWDSEEEKVRWANITAGKVYPVTFDATHDSLRWLLDAVKTMEGSTEKWAVEMEDYLPGTEEDPAKKTKKWYLNHGIEFELDPTSEPGAEEPTYRVCAAMLVDKPLGLATKFLGVDNLTLTNIFSFNTEFGSSSTEQLTYIGRPLAYELSGFQYKKEVEGQEVTIIESSGTHVWTADADGVTVQLLIPDNMQHEVPGDPTSRLVPHRDTYIVRIDTDNALDTNSIYRHTITLRSATDLDKGDYELNLSMCAVNSEAGDSDISYLLHSDESYQSIADWILPVSGTIGKVIGYDKKGTVIRPTGNGFIRPGYNKILIAGNFNVNSFEKLWESLPKQVANNYYVYAADNKLTAEGDEEALENPIRLRIEKVAPQTGSAYYNIHLHKGCYSSSWDCETGLPADYPEIPESAESPYTYTFKDGDYFTIDNIPESGTKYMPDGSSMTATKVDETWTWSVSKKEYTGAETLATGKQFSYITSVWSYEDAANAPYRIILDERAINRGLCYYDTDVKGYVKLSPDTALFTYPDDEPTIGKQWLMVEGEDILIGWDNEILYELFSAENNFAQMNRVSHSYSAVRMRASWQTIDEKDVRTLFIDYIDMAGEWNSVPVITDSNAWKYICTDFRSEILAVKTPMSRAIKKVAVAK